MRNFANITGPMAKAIIFASICRRAHTHLRSNFSARMVCELLRTRPTQEVSSTFPSVAVLPFDDLSAGRNLSYFGDGVAEDIITALSRFPDLAVVARTSSFTYKGKAVDIRQVGEELGVGYVVEGSVRKDGDRLELCLSSLTPRMATMFGPSVLTGRAWTLGHFRTRSPE